VKKALGNVVRNRLRLGGIGLILVAMLGVQLIEALPSSASTVTNPALAKVGATGRFTTPIVMDGGIISVTPAPASVQTLQGIGGMTAKVWATQQLAGFAKQTLGWGYVTVRGTAKGEKRMVHVLAWVGFANGNTSGVCAKNSAGKFRTNGESAAVLGDANFSQAISYVPPGCGPAQRSGYRVPDEVVSVPWVKVGTASAHGVITFQTQVAQCGGLSGRTTAKGAALEVLLYSQRPDWSAKVCSANIAKLGIPIAKTAAKANATSLVHGVSGPVRQVVIG
jgi:hypothetical protein